jgi:sulfotransferase family protein
MPSGPSPIFIVGTGRSGTTLLRFMLCAHPRIYITHEASFYFWQAFRPRRHSGSELLDYYFQTPSFRWLRLDPARVLAGLPEPLPRARVGEAYAAVMREKAAQYGRVRYGDKTPLHAGHLPRIFADFPEARVIHIVRDPRATSLSLSRMPWAAASLYTNTVFCELERRQVSSRDARVLKVRLEDLLADPRATMGRVLEHVGEPWDEAVLDHARHLPDKHDMPPLPWLESAAHDRAPPAAEWKRLAPLQIRVVEHVARHIMKEFDYAPAQLEPSAEPGRLAVWWAEIRELPGLVRYLASYWRLSRFLYDPRNFETEASWRLFRRVNPGSWARYPGFAMPAAPPLPALPAPGAPRELSA